MAVTSRVCRQARGSENAKNAGTVVSKQGPPPPPPPRSSERDSPNPPSGETVELSTA